MSLEQPEWMARGACIGLPPAVRDQVFFPGQGESVAPAKRICRDCPVRSECLAYALANGEKFGIWGGKSERDRRRIRAEQRRARTFIEQEEAS